MNKPLSIAAVSALLTTAANADLMRIEGAVGAWQTDPTGTMQYGQDLAFDVVDNAGFESSQNVYAWVYIKHPIPIVPNLRLEYVDPTFDGTVATLEWNGNTYASVNNTLSLTQYDAVLYYNILDNTFWSTIDLGLDIKFIDGSYKLDASTAAGAAPAVDESFSLAMPLAYARARVQLPVTNIGFEAIARGMSYTGNTVVDAQIKVDYTMDFIPVIQPGLELGYRYQQVTLDGDSIGLDASIDTTFSGVYGGIMVRF